MIPIGAKRTENLNNGRLLSTALMSTNFPAMLSQEDPQAYIFELNFSSRGFQSFLKALLRKMGRPRYLKEVQFEEAAKPRHLAMEFSDEGEIFQQ